MSEKEIDHSNLQSEGVLFGQVQRSNIFKDSKTFVDSEKKRSSSKIRKEFFKNKNKTGFDLNLFLKNNFKIPDPENIEEDFSKVESMESYIQKFWSSLERSADESNPDSDTLIPLRNMYMVPGGRFREIYYWDSYFIMEGLAACSEIDILEDIIENFVSLIQRFNFIPNGNRSYYLSRSQPPLFFLMLEIMEEENEEKITEDLISLVEKEYSFWMERKESRKEFKHVVKVKEGFLNRYWDKENKPRPESYTEDVELVSGIDKELRAETYRNIRAAAESGWDFSSRWFEDPQDMKTIQTTDILPVDLNSILFGMEAKLAEWSKEDKARDYRKKSESRKKLIDRYFWNQKKGFYFDYNWKKDQQEDTWSLAGVFPLFFEIASKEQADKVKENLEDKFLEDGGLLTTLYESGHQWDKPNGWAPLHWFAINGLLNYGYCDLAQKIAERWIDTNRKVFKSASTMKEKYNVMEPGYKAERGEYETQEGFGWTNGVAIALIKNNLTTGNSGKLNTESLKQTEENSLV